jgi:hypothetical protein
MKHSWHLKECSIGDLAGQSPPWARWHGRSSWALAQNLGSIDIT